MAICDNCGKKFNMTEAEDEFMTEHGMFISDSELFNNKTLCFECADEAMERRDYYERCEQCGKLFYVCDDDWFDRQKSEMACKTSRVMV